MNFRLFPANERGHADYGWLKTYYSFSFANWYNPHLIHFGMLRVLNDDTIAPHSGFDFHPHKDMEIITIMLEGELTHEDSMGNKGTIQQNEVQVMSAGSGIFHSEKNSSDSIVKLFQIWIFPDQKNLTPRYEQMKYELKNNELIYLVTPFNEPIGLHIHQNAYISRILLEQGKSFDYSLHHSDNGLYLMCINGQVEITQQLLNNRDAIGIWDTNKKITFQTQNILSDLLLIEVPMH
ncbi:MAG: hypothetical protein KatS3mg027_0631 [Bacteroidia bacterium]|nr:MAG: hypothetical protein KatS3mg027_0631 [Bacteroidia bacterium]